jgi:hypothetical protein
MGQNDLMTSVIMFISCLFGGAQINENAWRLLLLLHPPLSGMKNQHSNAIMLRRRNSRPA